jgi:hypothetical protein
MILRKMLIEDSDLGGLLWEEERGSFSQGVDGGGRKRG